MSTKDTRSALKRLKEYAHAAMDDGAWNLALAAEAEVEAIESAAKVTMRHGDTLYRDVSPEEVRAAEATLCAIAKDAE